MRQKHRLGAALAFAAARATAAAMLAGCDVGPERQTAITRPIVYGSDDRKEYFDLAQAGERSRMADSMVALVPRASVGFVDGVFEAAVPTWGEQDNLCPGEPFGGQPAAAFCSGVLVDWDLVLTAGHCVRLFAPEDMVAVRGYHYAAPGLLAVGTGDVLDLDEIVAEALDPVGTEPRLDFAWLRLARPVEPPWRPVPLYTKATPLEADAPIVTIGSGGGVPLKLDDGGRVRELRENWFDFFTADTDTSHGSSGGGAFDQGLSLVGIMVRGGADFVSTDAGCNVTAREPEGAAPQEQFTYVHRAVTALCDATGSSSSICRADCTDPCEALPLPGAAGCRYAGADGQQSWMVTLAAGILLASALRRRAREHHQSAHRASFDSPAGPTRQTQRRPRFRVSAG